MTAPQTPAVPDLAVATFQVLRQSFFDPTGKPTPFGLRDKRNTQDDPFDEYVHQLLQKGIPDTDCEKAPGALITPDIVLLRPTHCQKATKEMLRADFGLVLGIEVKKVERTAGGRVARAAGMDYNTTPPCGVIRVYDASNQPVDIRGFYLFVCMETIGEGKSCLSALCLCDGNVLNKDFDLYLQITGQRQKRIGMGTYGDGADRQRPMLIFSNPLGVTQLDRAATLIHPSSTLEGIVPGLKLAYTLTRTAGEEKNAFYCYRGTSDIPAGHTVEHLQDPFPVPERVKETQGRGRFLLSFRLAGG